MIRIALVDKHPVLRKGLITELNSHFTGVAAAESDNLLSLWNADTGFVPDIIIIGLDQLNLETAPELVQMLRELYPVTTVIILDYMLNPTMAHFFLSEGVMGYVSKDASVAELIDCLRIVMKGKRHISPELLIWMLRESKKQPYGNLSVFHPKGLLTRHEMEIAICIANDMPVRWIADLFDRKQVSITMIKSTIFRKLGVGSVHQLRQVLHANSR